MPILGVIASSRQVAVADTGSMFPIATFTLGANTASVDFTNIPQTYKHLQLRVIARTDRANTGDTIYWRYNNDGTGIYTLHSMYGLGSGNAQGDKGTGLTYGYYLSSLGASATSGVFSMGIINILDYSNTSKFKTTVTHHGNETSSSGIVLWTSSLWQSTSAITRITFTSQNLANLVPNCSFALYGVNA
jgi:hypothetical protein